MPALSLKTPGVYIEERNGFPNSVVSVATAVPAFIGYTPQASYEGKSYTNIPMRVSSMDEFAAIFLLPSPLPPAPAPKQYSPEYYLAEQKSQPTAGSYLELGGTFYSILPDPYTIYYMYNSIRLFFQNGGGDVYIVSVGSYGDASKKPLAGPSDPIINPNVKLSDLTGGLELLKNETEPTMYICPEATLLSAEENGTLMAAMLSQASVMQTAICLLDIIGGRDPDPILFMDDIEAFRNSTGANGLDSGAAYYPWVGTTIMQAGEIDFTNLFGGDVKALGALINPPAEPNEVAGQILDMIESPPDPPLSNSQYSAALSIASPMYANILKYVTADCNVLPPSGGMAGVYNVNDEQEGVWHAPANTTMGSVASLPIRLSDGQQEKLNVDAVSGKSVNAIRYFNGQGILIWGARTLDGNSNDWRYISVRRTVTMLEQSVKLAARAYVFESNTANTWGAVKSMIGSYLTNVWKAGGLMGSSPEEAFNVDVGLGSTMTEQDVLEGLMKVTVKVAIVRPAEFIVITFEQQMPKSG